MSYMKTKIQQRHLSPPWRKDWIFLCNRIRLTVINDATFSELMDRFKDLCKTFNDEHPEGMTEDDKRRIWAEAKGEYGQGSLKKTSIEEDLRKLMEEDLRRSITEQV
ncbi:hypothetical protein V2J09_009102 [Rumex salicifolius]